MCLDSRTACKHKLKISQSHLLHSTNQADPRPPLPYKSRFVPPPCHAFAPLYHKQKKCPPPLTPYPLLFLNYHSSCVNTADPLFLYVPVFLRRKAIKQFFLRREPDDFLLRSGGLFFPTGQGIPPYGLPQWVLPILCTHHILLVL